MVKSLLFLGAGAGAGEKNTRSRIQDPKNVYLDLDPDPKGVKMKGYNLYQFFIKMTLKHH